MRNKLLEFLKSELIGPDINSPYKQENGEEILIISPRDRYITGILYPQGSIEQEKEKPRDDNEIVNSSDTDETDLKLPEADDIPKGNALGKEDGNDDEITNLANAFLPSAMGVSCYIKFPAKGLKVTISTATYKRQEFSKKVSEEQTKLVPGYFRESLNYELVLNSSQMPNADNPYVIFEVKKNGQPTGLILHIINRIILDSQQDGNIYTFSLINTRKGINGRAKDEDCFFQVGFSVTSQEAEKCFLPYKQASRDTSDESLSRELLFMHRKVFAIGHGCSPTWEDTNEESVSSITAEIMPVAFVKNISPTEIENLQLSMYNMSNANEKNQTISTLNTLCTEYEKWINQQEELAISGIPSKLQATATKHLDQCRLCLQRMREGIKLLEEDENNLLAFQWMNKAMLLQQIHYNLPVTNWTLNERGTPSITIEDLPDASKPDTWPKKNLGIWRPFQLAFILLNIKSIAIPDCDEREIVDLIWFPTGGGKTEAYLGLSAFTIFLRRLKNNDDDGTTVLMRYTLRLLTTQQFQRASSLICACEKIRTENQSSLGQNRISIGLWVGNDLTPNRRQQAKDALKQLQENEKASNPFLIYQCPWCGAGMGPVKSGNLIKSIGYETSTDGKTVVLKCKNSKCDFFQDTLPLIVIDEDIYEFPPTLIIGTVDKFAMMVWRPEGIRRLFGYRGEEKKLPPELIIQDELHLISGPLGSMVGSYETLIDTLCTYPLKDKQIKAKIIASTATVSRASEQIHALYNRGLKNVFLFPAQALKSGDSFFAREDPSTTEARMYVGVHAAGFSHPTAHARVISALLQGVKIIDATDDVKNYYWTILDYFNSLRELGYAVTRIHADIPEFMNRMWLRMNLSPRDKPDVRRFIQRFSELTSRIPSGKISNSLEELKIDYSSTDKNQHPVDICMATNMISVGVDVSRLGIMTVTGQPKTTSEYIQATSRVGRDTKKGPGIVVVIYNPTKPRDRSHYERFHSYHSKIYSFVEPTSVTPFSAPVLDRSLHALLVGLVRYLGSSENREFPQKMPEKKLIEKIEEIIGKRVEQVEPSELEYARNLLKEKIHQWATYLPPNYGILRPDWKEPTLLYPWNIKPPSDYEKRAWATPTSMRNVDPSCEGDIITEYGE